MVWKIGERLFLCLSVFTVLAALVTSFYFFKPASFSEYGMCLIDGILVPAPVLYLFVIGILFCKKKLGKPSKSDKKHRRRDRLYLDRGQYLR